MSLETQTHRPCGSAWAQMLITCDSRCSTTAAACASHSGSGTARCSAPLGSRLASKAAVGLGERVRQRGCGAPASGGSGSTRRVWSATAVSLADGCDFECISGSGSAREVFASRVPSSVSGGIVLRTGAWHAHPFTHDGVQASNQASSCTIVSTSPVTAVSRFPAPCGRRDACETVPSEDAVVDDVAIDIPSRSFTLLSRGSSAMVCIRHNVGPELYSEAAMSSRGVQPLHKLWQERKSTMVVGL